MLALSVWGLGSPGLGSPLAYPEVSGLELMPQGIRVAGSVADTLYFSGSAGDLRLKRSDSTSRLWQGRDFAFGPGAFEVSDWRPGVRVYFPLGLRLRVTTDLAPFVTWGEGSVGSEVPSAASSWFLLNFRDGQPPLMLVFESPVQLLAGGDSGNWSISTVDKFKGWVRVLAPIGPQRVAANVSSLGELAKRVGPLAEMLSLPDPKLTGFEVRSDSGFLTAIWSFDVLGARVPVPLLLCRQGGYEAKLLTGLTPSLVDYAEGPVALSREPRIAVRFPMRRIPVGRGLAVGKFRSVMSSASGYDLPSVVELALSVLGRGQDEATREVANSCFDEFRRGLSPGELVADVGGGSQVAASDLLAGHALLQGAMNQDGGAGETLKTVLGRWDGSAWMIRGDSLESATRATALFAVAGSLVGDSSVRAKAAMAQASCSAMQVMGEYRRKRGFAALEGRVVSPVAGLRAELFGDVTRDLARSSFVGSLASPIRAIGFPGIEVERVGSGYVLSWVHRGEGKSAMALISPYPIEVEAKENIASLVPRPFLAETRLLIQAKDAGVCRLLLRVPAWVEDLPELVDSPRYSE